MKKVIIAAAIMCVLVFAAPAAIAAEVDTDINEIYLSQFEASGADKLSEALPEDVREQMDEYSFDLPDGSDSLGGNINGVFEKILDFINKGYKAPLAAGCSVLGILLLACISNSIARESGILKYVLITGITAVSVVPVASALVSTVDAVRSAGIFMISFVPIYAAILAASGKTLTAAGYSTVMLVVSEGVSWLCSFILLPLSSIQLALGIGGALMPDGSTGSISKTIKKVSGWLLSLASTVLLGVLGVQTSVSNAADTLTAKTAKFIVGTTVPVVGNAVSEALGTVRGCISVLRSSVAVYGIIAVALIVLPLLTELMLWRLSMNICSSAAEVLSQSKASMLLKAVDTALSFFVGVIILIFVLFVISLTVVVIV